MIHPSILAHIVSGAFMFVALFCLVNSYSQLRKLDAYRSMVLILLFSIAVGLHGVSHLGLEKQYSYNPIDYFGF
jgi:hypothetical protein